MEHITSAKNYRVLSSGVIIIRKEGAGLRFLLLRSYSYWDFPKGLVEEGEDPFEGALREVREETTITDLDFKWGKDFMETEPYNKGKIARYYMAETKQQDISLPVNPQIGRAEHEEYKWATYEEVLSLIAPRVKRVFDWAYPIITGQARN